MQIYISTNTIRELRPKQIFFRPSNIIMTTIFHVLYTVATKRIPTVVFIMAAAHRLNRSNYIKYHII